MKEVNVLIIIIIIAIIAFSAISKYASDGNLAQFASIKEPVEQEASGSAGAEPKGSYAVPEEEPEETTTSPYYGKARIQNVQKENSYNPSLINIYIRAEQGEKINITGWKIKTRKGEFEIPKGVEAYNSFQDPRNIIIKENMTIYLIGDVNPLGKDRNFRTNQCFGYLAEYNDFYPNIYIHYSRPSLEDISYLRWLYTGVTRARKKLFLIGFKEDYFEN